MKIKHRSFSFFVFLTILVYIFALPVSATEPPSDILEASSVYVVNIETEGCAYEYMPQIELQPSATAKLMTALTAYRMLEGRLSERVLITPEMTAGYSRYQSFYINEWKSLEDYRGTYIEIKDLFELLLISGSEDAAQSLALLCSKSTDEFVSEMNKYAAELGMTTTIYKNVTGSNVTDAKTTAKDVSRLACEFYKKAELVRIASVFNSEIAVGADKVTIFNRNPVSSTYYNNSYYDKSINGLLYGASSRTDTCLITEKTGGNLSYICIIMGADSQSALRDSEGRPRNAFTLSSSLLEYALESFELKCVLENHRIFAELPVKMSRQADYVTLVPQKELFAFLPKNIDFDSDLKYEVSLLKSELEAPLMQGEVLGSVEVLYGEKSLGSVELIANNAVSKSLILDIADFFMRLLKNPITVTFIIFALIFLVLSIFYRAHIEALNRRDTKDSEPEDRSTPDRK